MIQDLVPDKIDDYILTQFKNNNLRISNQLNAVVIQEYKELCRQMMNRQKDFKNDQFKIWVHLENFILDYSINGK